MTQTPPPLTVDAAVQGAQLAGAIAPVNWQSGHITSYSEAPPQRILFNADNSQVDTPVKSILNIPLYPGTRVMVGYTPDGQGIVTGLIGRVPPPSGMVLRTTTQTIADATDTTIGPWSTSRYLYGGVMVSSVHGLSVPATGLWVASATLHWAIGALSTSTFYWVRLDRMSPDGVTFKETMAEVDGVGNGWSNVENLSTVAWPCNAGEQIRLRVRQYTLTTGAAHDVASADMAIRWAGMSADSMA